MKFFDGLLNKPVVSALIYSIGLGTLTFFVLMVGSLSGAGVSIGLVIGALFSIAFTLLPFTVVRFYGYSLIRTIVGAKNRGLFVLVFALFEIMAGLTTILCYMSLLGANNVGNNGAGLFLLTLGNIIGLAFWCIVTAISYIAVKSNFSLSSNEKSNVE